MIKVRYVFHDLILKLILDFHVSGPRDHNRETIRAKTNSENVKQQFKFKTMFSELRHHPRYETVFQQTDPVPGFINRNWSDRTQLPREESNVGGSDRFKYFRRPVVPYSQELLTDQVP